MAKHLGTPYVRGNSDVIVNYKPAVAALAAGTVVGLNSDGNLVQASATIVAIGIAGMAELSHQSVVKSGMEVYAKIAGTESPVIGKQAYFIPATGIVTSVSTDNTALNATFCSGLLDAVGGGKCIALDFVGGL